MVAAEASMCGISIYNRIGEEEDLKAPKPRRQIHLEVDVERAEVHLEVYTRL